MSLIRIGTGQSLDVSAASEFMGWTWSIYIRALSLFKARIASIGQEREFRTIWVMWNRVELFDTYPDASPVCLRSYQWVYYFVCQIRQWIGFRRLVSASGVRYAWSKYRKSIQFNGLMSLELCIHADNFLNHVGTLPLKEREKSWQNRLHEIVEFADETIWKA